MKKYLFTLVALLAVLTASAQDKALLMQPYQVAQQETAAIPQRAKTVDRQVAVRNVAAPAVKMASRKHARRALTAEDLQGDVIVATYLYDYNSETKQLELATVSRKGVAASIEATGENTINIYGIDENASEESAITATINADGTLTMPAGQYIWTYTDGTQFVMGNASSDGDFTGTVYDDGYIEINEIWYEQYTEDGKTGRNGKYRRIIIAPVNGTMVYGDTDDDGNAIDVDQNVLIVQDEDTKEVTVWNFHNFVRGVVVDITINPDKSFVIEGGEQIVYEHSTLNEIYLWGSPQAGRISDITGSALVDTELTSNVGIGYVNASYRGWVYPNAKFSITLTDGSEFEYPVPETGELVTPPAGLETKNKPFTAKLYAPSQTDYSTTVKVGWDGTDVYIQGLDKDLPEAWIKGTYDAEKGKVTVPITYMGQVGLAPHFFAAYGANGPVTLNLDYDADADLYTYSATVMIYQSATKTPYNYFYNGFVIGTKPTPTTAPEGLQTTDIAFKGNYFDDDAEEAEVKTGTVKVGRDGNDVYIQGLFATDVPSTEYGWIKGTLTESEGQQYVVFSKNQYVGDLSNGLAAYLTGYVPAEEEGGSGSAGNVVFTYTNDGTYETYTAANAVILTRFKNSTSYTAFYQAGLVISTNPDATGIRNIEAVKKAGSEAWYTLGGQRVAQPTEKGIYIHNGVKVVIK